MRKLGIFIISLLVIFIGVVNSSLVEARGISCNTTQDCFDSYQSSAYTCEFIEEENGYFCQSTRDCGPWQFSNCEGDFVIWKNDCGDIRKEQCLSCEEIQTEEREICVVIDEVTGERGDCRMVGGGISYRCSDETTTEPVAIGWLETEEGKKIILYSTIITISLIVVWWKFLKKK